MNNPEEEIKLQFRPRIREIVLKFWRDTLIQKKKYQLLSEKFKLKLHVK